MGTSPEDIPYYTARDQVETIQFPQMQNIVQAIYLVLLPVVMGE